MSFTVLRNRRTELSELPIQYVESITYEINSPAELSFSLPSTISYRGKTLPYLVYDEIQGKMIIISDINGYKEKFIIDDDFEIEDNGKIAWKRGKAYSYEKTLDGKSFIIPEGATRQLFRGNDTIEVSDGILDWFEQKTQWKVNYCDIDAKKETGIYPITRTRTIGTINKTVTKGTVLWQINGFNVSANSNKPLNITFNYPDMASYRGGVLQKSETITHTFSNLPYGLANVTCTYTSDDEYRFGATYTFVYTNGITETYKKPFSNVADAQVVIEGVNAVYETGDFGEQKNTKYRFFEACSTTWYSFLVNDVAKAFDCVFTFDSYNQTINVYAKDNFGESKGLHMSYETGIKSINKKHKIGEVVTRLYVQSSLTSISSENPLGGDYVECFDYYRKTGIMSSYLQEALDRYDALLSAKHVQWLNIKNEKMALEQRLTKLESELSTLNEKLKGENAILTAYIKAGDSTNQAIQSAVVAQLERQINGSGGSDGGLMKTIQDVKDNIFAKSQAITEIADSIVKEKATDNRGKIFTREDLDELEDYTIEGSMTDDYYTTPYGLYNYAVQQAKNYNDIQIEFEIETVDFLRKIIHPNGWQYLIQIGEKIEVDDKDILDRDGYVQLFGYTLYPADNKLNDMKFTNNKEPISALQSISDIGRATNQQATLTNHFKEIWKDSANNNVVVSQLREQGLDLSAQIARGRGDVNRIDITESGIYIIDAKDDNKQMYFGSGVLCITRDKWKTSELAIDASGVIEECSINRTLQMNNIFVEQGE